MAALPSPIAPYDPTLPAILTAAARLGEDHVEAQAKDAERLISYLLGNQTTFVQEYLDRMITNPVLKKRYKALARTWNVVRLFAKTLTVLGRRPLLVDWKSTEKNDLWNRVAGEGGARLAPFLWRVGRWTEILKTCTAHVAYDEMRERIQLSLFSAHTLDVAWMRENLCWTEPDVYRILVDEELHTYQVWDFTGNARERMRMAKERRDGTGAVTRPDKLATGKVWTQKAAPGDEIDWDPPKGWQPAPVIDPKTDLSLVPFVAFRTDDPTWGYITEDGQEDLIGVQDNVNKLLTQLAYREHYAAFRVVLLKGGNWRGSDGTEPSLPADPGVCWVGPDPGLPGEETPSAEVIDPGDVETLRYFSDESKEWAERGATIFGMPPGSMRFRKDPISGISLFVEAQSLREHFEQAVATQQGSVEELVRLIAVSWNFYHQDETERFPEDVKPSVTIPMVPYATPTVEKLTVDVQRIANGLGDRRTLAREWNPYMSDADLEKMVSAYEAGLRDQASAAATGSPGRSRIFGGGASVASLGTQVGDASIRSSSQAQPPPMPAPGPTRE